MFEDRPDIRKVAYVNCEKNESDLFFFFEIKVQSIVKIGTTTAIINK